jgi:choline dehydrogenase-like flavoprotein
VDSTDEYLNFTIGIMSTQSRGQVTLRSADPADPPLIDPNYLDHPLDRRFMIEGIKSALQYIKSPRIAKYLKEIVNTPKGDHDTNILVRILYC